MQENELNYYEKIGNWDFSQIKCKTENLTNWDFYEKIKESFNLTPNGIIDYLKLKEPIYSKTSNYGHFGREGFSWEKIIQI